VLRTVTSKNIINLHLLQNINVLHANEAEAKKTTGEGRKLPGAVATVATLAAADAAGVVV
jgi:hypothetical protein